MMADPILDFAAFIGLVILLFGGTSLLCWSAVQVVSGAWWRHDFETRAERQREHDRLNQRQRQLNIALMNEAFPEGWKIESRPQTPAATAPPAGERQQRAITLE